MNKKKLLITFGIIIFIIVISILGINFKISYEYNQNSVHRLNGPMPDTIISSVQAFVKAIDASAKYVGKVGLDTDDDILGTQRVFMQSDNDKYYIVIEQIQETKTLKKNLFTGAKEYPVYYYDVQIYRTDYELYFNEDGSSIYDFYANRTNGPLQHYKITVNANGKISSKHQIAN